MMQKTRQRILEYLKEHGEATVEELSAMLDNLTPVTVRHHLDVMRSEGLVETPNIRRRSSPGRPRFIYRLSHGADAHFPQNLSLLTDGLLTEIKARLSERQADAILTGVAERMARLAPPTPPGATLEERLAHVVDFLNQNGYMARWEKQPQGYVLTTCNCPYGVAESHPEMCLLDIRYISALLGITPNRLSHMLEGDSACSYLIPETAGTS